ncbi:hypothetical protein V8F06_014174 [Rhypophila decipiens]
MDVDIDMAGGMEPAASSVSDTHPDHDGGGHDDGRGHGHGHGSHGSHDGRDSRDGRDNSHDSPTNGNAQQPRRRNRPALSCLQCRSRKIRCDRSEPCASCIKSKIVNCHYEEARRPKPRLWKLSPAPSSGPSRFNGPQPADGAVPRFTAETPYRDPPPPAAASSVLPYASSAASVPSVRTSDSASASLHSPPGRHAESTADSLVRQIHQLQQQLADVRGGDGAPLTSQSSQSTPSSHPAPAPAPAPAQASLNKMRYIGSSHWTNDAKLFPAALRLAERVFGDKSSSTFHAMQKCKEFGRAVKAQRIPTQISFDIGSAVPPEGTACRLVEAYFRTFESVYRILHGPSFWREYRTYWNNAAAADPVFVLQFQLCMAIGSCFQDDVVTLRPVATRWIYEAQVWLVSPSVKARMNIGYLQVMCLLHLAKEACGVGGDLGWISAGGLVRTAMFMGLHRDPDALPAKMPVIRAEMRRRLWATILEITLQSSLDAGGPPLISLSDFDTRAPSNFDDDQLSENDQSPPPTARPLSTFTQTTVQLALLRSFPTRLAIAHFVNHFNSASSYDETLRLSSDLTTACRALSATIQPSYDPTGVFPKRLSLFQLRLAEQNVHRFFLALHHPWLFHAQNNPTYYFSRKMCVETALKLYRAFSTCSPAGASGTASQTDDFTRLSTCGHGAFRSVPIQAILTIYLELLWQAQDDRSFRQSLNIDHQLDRPATVNDTDVSSSSGLGNGVAPSHDLLDAAKYSIGWSERRIRTGEVSVKGHVFFSVLLAQAQALQRGASDGEVDRVIQDAFADDLNYCWHVLKETADITATPLPGNGGYGKGGGGEMNGAGDYELVGREWDNDLDFDFGQGFGSIFNLNDINSFVAS